MNIYYDADIEPRVYEGRSQTAILLKTFLQKQGFNFVDQPGKADLIHVHSSGIFASFRAARLKQKYNVPVIYSLYSISKTEPINHIRNHLAQQYYLRPRQTSFLLSYSAILPLKLRGFKLKQLDKVITPSFFVKKRLLSNTEVIRLGIDVNTFKPAFSQNSLPDNYKNTCLLEKSLKIGYIGHPSAYKGLLDFVRASKLFSTHHQNSVYLSDISPKMQAKLSKINPRLQIFGYTENIAEIYNSLDIIILPYRSHLAGVANPLVLLEAMACGKAIITTNFPYLREIIKDSAIQVKPYSPKAIRDAVKKLEDKQLRQQLGCKARLIIEQEFSQEAMLQKYSQLYYEFTAKRN